MTAARTAIEEGLDLPAYCLVKLNRGLGGVGSPSIDQRRAPAMVTIGVGALVEAVMQEVIGKLVSARLASSDIAHARSASLDFIDYHGMPTGRTTFLNAASQPNSSDLAGQSINERTNCKA